MKIVPVSLAVLVRKCGEDYELWMQERVEGGPYHGLLEFPGGKIEPQERPLLAARREFLEEVGQELIGPSLFFGLRSNKLKDKGKEIILHIFLFKAENFVSDSGKWILPEADKLDKEVHIPVNLEIIDSIGTYLRNQDKSGQLEKLWSL